MIVSICLNVVFILGISIWAYMTRIDRLIDKWDKELDEFLKRKHELDDLIMLANGSFGTHGDMSYGGLKGKLKRKLKEYRKKREERLKKHTIASGEVFSLENLIKIIEDRREEIQEYDSHVMWVDERIKELSMDVKERADYIILQIHRAMERIRTFIRRGNYKASGDLLVPVFERLFVRGIKHLVFSNIEEYNEEDSVVEFGRGQDEVIECLEVKTIEERIGNAGK